MEEQLSAEAMQNKPTRTEIIDTLRWISLDMMAVSQLLEGIQEIAEHEYVPIEQLNLLERLTNKYADELRAIADNM